ncbi:MAG: tetratricopeptide repeat protein [bacterium]
MIFKKDNIISMNDDAQSLPFSIHSILLSRFNDLPNDTKRIIEIAACIGREFSAATLAKIAPDKKFNLESAYEKGIILKIGEIYQFKHAFFQDAIQHSLLDTNRKKYEKLISKIFIEEKRTPYEIAHHLTEAGEAYLALPYWYNTFEELHDKGFHNEIANIIQRLGNYDDEHTKDVGAFINALYLTKMADYYDAEQILTKLKKKEDIRKEVLYGLAGLYDWSTQYEKMVVVLKELRHLPMKIDEKLSYLELYGIYYDMMGDNQKGLAYYRKSLKIAQKYKLRKSLSVCLFNIGWIYFKERRYDRAETYFRKSLSFIKEGELFLEGSTLLRLGQIEMLKGNLDLSQDYLKKSLRKRQWIF